MSKKTYEYIPKISHMHFLLTNKEFSKLGLYKGQPGILLFINENEKVTNSQISKRFNIKPSTVTVVINRMIKSGILSKDDMANISLTKKGIGLLEESEKIMNDIEKVIYKGFSREEKKQLNSYFEKIYLNLKNELGGLE